MLIKKKIDEPYNKNPGYEPLPILSKTSIKSKLSKKFWKITEHIYNPNLSNNQIIPKKKKVEKNNIKIIKESNKINIKKENNNFDVIRNDNKSNNKLKNKRVKTPAMKSNNLINMEKNKNDEYFYYIKDNINKESKYQDELNLLRKNAIKLEEELEKNKIIIEIQEKENKELTQRIEKLIIMLKSIIPKDNI